MTQQINQGMVVMASGSMGFIAPAGVIGQLIPFLPSGVAGGSDANGAFVLNLGDFVSYRLVTGLNGVIFADQVNVITPALPGQEGWPAWQLKGAKL